MRDRLMSKMASNRFAEDDMSYETMAVAKSDKKNLIYSPSEIQQLNDDNRKYTLEQVLRLIGERLSKNYPFDDYRIYFNDIKFFGHDMDVDAVLEALTEAGWAVGVERHANPPYLQFNGSL